MEGGNAKPLVLFADDSRSLLQTAGKLLEEEGCEVLTATTGMEALCHVAERLPRLVFIDKACPLLNGFQLCALLKAHDKYEDIRVVLLSDGEDIFERARARYLGAQCILCKPFSKGELMDVIAADHSHGG